MFFIDFPLVSIPDGILVCWILSNSNSRLNSQSFSESLPGIDSEFSSNSNLTFRLIVASLLVPTLTVFTVALVLDLGSSLPSSTDQYCGSRRELWNSYDCVILSASTERWRHVREMEDEKKSSSGFHRANNLSSACSSCQIVKIINHRLSACFHHRHTRTCGTSQLVSYLERRGECERSNGVRIKQDTVYSRISPRESNFRTLVVQVWSVYRITI